MNNSQETNKKVCAVIPFFNEENTITHVIEKVSQYVDIIIAVDDGSTDQSKELINSNDKVIVLSH